MKKYINYILVVLAVFTGPLKLISQNSDLSLIQSKIENYNALHLPEKLYLHTDKSVYINNEICWFKIYTVDGFFHHPLAINKVAYIELLDANNQPILQEKVGLQNASGKGSLQLPANIPSGNYTLVAYTNWMKNFKNEFFFSKNITVINTQYNEVAVMPKNTLNYTIQFYPEGGNLLAGFENKIAFSVYNTYGVGTKAKGWIVNNKGDTVCQFNTLQNGIGSFKLNPQFQTTYKAITETPNGNLETPLPTANENGYALSINNIVNNNIQITTNLSNNKYGNAYLIIHCRGIVKKAVQVPLTKPTTNLELSLDALGEGINTITLFDDNKKPVAERLYFKFPQETNNQINIETDKLKNRTKVNLTLHSNSTSVYDASISVYKLDSIQGIDEMNIQNYLLLSADLVGKIESPASYFDLTNANHKIAMDNLMLTHGWRRFNNEDIENKNTSTFKYLPELGGSIITGKIINKGTNLPAKETAGYISVPSKNTVFTSALSDQEGKIKFQFQEFNNDGQIIAQADSNKTVKNKIAIDNPFIGKNNKLLNTPPIEMAKLSKAAIENRHRNIQVQSFYSPASNNQYAPNLQDTNAFYVNADRTYFLDDYARFTTLEEVIREYVTPVTLVKEKGRYQFYVYDDAYKQFFEQSPLVLLDGVIIKDIDKFLAYDPLKIRKLEVVSRVYFSGNLAYNGVINFTTYTGKLEGFEIDPNAVVLDYKGLQSQRIFNSPMYEHGNQIDSRLPDFRQVLYWNPTATIGKKTNYSFYTSDVKGNFMISVQGINKDGNIFNSFIPFTVQ